MPVKNLTDQLRQISTSMQQSSSQLQQLMTDLPKQLDKQATTDKQLYELAYPAGQSCAPLVTKESQHAAQHGSSSNWGTGSVVGSSAAPSLRSRSVRSASSSAASGSALGQHPLPLLRVPEVAEQQVGGVCAAAGQHSQTSIMHEQLYALVWMACTACWRVWDDTPASGAKCPSCWAIVQSTLQLSA